MKLIVTVAGQAHELEDGGLADLVAFERHFGLPSSVLSPEDETPMRAEWLAFLAYRGLRKAKVIDAAVTFDDAVEMIEDFDVKTEESDDAAHVPDPTKAPVAEP